MSKTTNEKDFKTEYVLRLHSIEKNEPQKHHFSTNGPFSNYTDAENEFNEFVITDIDEDEDFSYEDASEQEIEFFEKELGCKIEKLVEIALVKRVYCEGKLVSSKIVQSWHLEKEQEKG